MGRRKHWVWVLRYRKQVGDASTRTPDSDLELGSSGPYLSHPAGVRGISYDIPLAHGCRIICSTSSNVPHTSYLRLLRLIITVPYLSISRMEIWLLDIAKYLHWHQKSTRKINYAFWSNQIQRIINRDLTDVSRLIFSWEPAPILHDTTCLFSFSCQFKTFDLNFIERMVSAK